MFALRDLTLAGPWSGYFGTHLFIQGHMRIT